MRPIPALLLAAITLIPVAVSAYDTPFPCTGGPEIHVDGAFDPGLSQDVLELEVVHFAGVVHISVVVMAVYVVDDGTLASRFDDPGPGLGALLQVSFGNGVNRYEAPITELTAAFTSDAAPTLRIEAHGSWFPVGTSSTYTPLEADAFTAVIQSEARGQQTGRATFSNVCGLHLGSEIQLAGVGPRFEGPWSVASVTEHFDFDSGHRTDVVVQADREGEAPIEPLPILREASPPRR